jgi:cobalt-zinc-cadmium efflux system outer membrane protein
VRSEAALYDLSQELKHARAQVESLRDTVIPQAREALGLTRRGYANGRYSQIDLLDAQRTLLELESEQLRNAADYHRTLAAIERMTALAPAARTGNPTP